MELLGARGRDVVSIFRTLPGVSYQQDPDALGGGFGTTTPNIGGNRNTMNSMTVDGQMSNDLGSPQIFSSTTNLDAIGEVSVELNNYRAEHGRNAGAVVNIVTKSGTRDYKGTAYWYRRHEQFNANDFFNNRNGVAKPLYRYSTQGVRARRAGAEDEGAAVLLLLVRGSQHADAAAAAHRDGADRARARRRLLAEPRGQRQPDRRPRSAAPASRSPATASRPTASTATVRRCSNVFPHAEPARSQRDARRLQLHVPGEPRRAEAAARLPRRLSADAIATSSTCAARRGSRTARATRCRPARRTGACSACTTRSPTTALLGNWTRILSSSMVNELSVGARRSEEAGPPLNDDELAAADARRGGVHAWGSSRRRSTRSNIIPQASFTGVPGTPAAITYDGRTPLTGADTVYTFNDTLTWTRGDHVLKAGFYMEHTRNQEGATATFGGNFDLLERREQSAATPATPTPTRCSATSRSTPNRRRGRAATARAKISSGSRRTPGAPTRKLTLDYGAALRLLHALASEGRAGGGLLARALRSGAGAALLSAGARRDDARRAGSGDRADRAGRADRRVRAGHRRSGQRHGARHRRQLSGRLPRAAAGAGRAARRVRLRPARQRQDRDPRQLRHLLQHAATPGNTNWTASRNPPLQFNPTLFYGNLATLLQSSTVLFPSNVQGFAQEVRDAAALQLHDRRAARHRLEHGRRRRLRRHEGPASAQHAEHQHRAVRRALPAAEPGSDACEHARCPDNFFRPYPGYGDITLLSATSASPTTTRCRCR